MTATHYLLAVSIICLLEKVNMHWMGILKLKAHSRKAFLWGQLFLWSSAQHRSCPDHPGKVKCSNYLLPWHHVLLCYSTPPHCNFVFTCVIISLRSVSLAKLQVPQEQDVWFCLLLCLAQHWHIGWGRFSINTCWKEGVIGCLQYFR